MSNTKLCVCCQTPVDEYFHEYEGDIYCEDCFFDNFAICDICGDVEPIDNIHWIDSEDRHVCEGCFDANYDYCDNCGEAFHRWNMRWLEDDHLCNDCFDREAFWCDRCEEYVHEDNWDFDNDCCIECSSKIIGGYHSHTFHKIGTTDIENNKFHKGCEIEVENIKGWICNDDMAQEISTFSHNIYFEHDGSLDDGFEIITQPHTFDRFYKIDWEGIFDALVGNGFRSHNTDSCGLHIHYSREYFGMTRLAQEANIGKMIAFYERNLDDLLKFSRRSWGSYQRWARGYDTEGNVEMCKDCAKRGNDRYHYINCTNSATIEFRLARGTLNYKSFMAWNNFHDCLVSNVKNVSFEDIDNYSTWLRGIKKETLEYMKSRDCFNKVIDELM